MISRPVLVTGQKRSERGYFQPAEGLEIPFAVIEGATPGPALLITAGVHGSEFCSIEAAVRMMKVSPEDIRGTLLVLPILNVRGFHKRSIYVMPEDGKNLNRVFPGRPDGTASERLAHWLVTSVYPQVDAYIDLHGGDLDESLSPFTIFPEGCRRSYEMAEAFGLPIAIATNSPGHTVHAARQLGVPSILPEVSGNGLWDDEKVSRITDGVRRVMGQLGMLQEAVSGVGRKPLVVRMTVPKAPCTGLWYSFREPGDHVAREQPLGEIRDVFGKTLSKVVADRDGLVVYRLTSLSVNESEALLGIGEDIPFHE